MLAPLTPWEICSVNVYKYKVMQPRFLANFTVAKWLTLTVLYKFMSSTFLAIGLGREIGLLSEMRVHCRTENLFLKLKHFSFKEEDASTTNSCEWKHFVLMMRTCLNVRVMILLDKCMFTFIQPLRCPNLIVLFKIHSLTIKSDKTNNKIRIVSRQYASSYNIHVLIRRI